jgi:hypothetical protein
VGIKDRKVGWWRDYLDPLRVSPPSRDAPLSRTALRRIARLLL